jgi:predicted acylesterase/phospholipase RssA
LSSWALPGWCGVAKRDALVDEAITAVCPKARPVLEKESPLMTPSWPRIVALLAGLVTVLAGCAAFTPTRVAPPETAVELAVASGLPGARLWGDDVDPVRQAATQEEFRRALIAAWDAAGSPADGLEVAMLALSGGGSEGAYAAGLLAGWSERGDRPAFDVVTGISAGALVAPFAFAGPGYDEPLRIALTGIDAQDVAQLQIFRALFGALGIARSDPLRRQIERFIGAPLLARIAERHRRGARLLVGTTNIDVARPVIWDMGKIAAAGEVELFRDVILASASIPGAFPPVGIEVELDGERFTEFHVDGAVTHAVFIGPVRAADALPRDLPFPVERTIYVIVNNTLLPDYQPVAESLRAITWRSLTTLLRAQAAGDLIRIYLAAEEADAGFRLSFIPTGLTEPAGGAFDGAYIRAVYQAAREQALAGVAWMEQPPELLGRRTVLGGAANRDASAEVSGAPAQQNWRHRRDQSAGQARSRPAAAPARGGPGSWHRPPAAAGTGQTRHPPRRAGPGPA